MADFCQRKTTEVFTILVLEGNTQDAIRSQRANHIREHSKTKAEFDRHAWVVRNHRGREFSRQIRSHYVFVNTIEPLVEQNVNSFRSEVPLFIQRQGFVTPGERRVALNKIPHLETKIPRFFIFNDQSELSPVE